MQVIVFDLWGDLGHFRKFFTTSSPLTFAFPPPPTVAGILGAIYGTDKMQGFSIRNRYLEVFGYEKCRIAVRIMRPIEKIRLAINLLDTKESPNNFRTQVKTEFLKNPRYRLYVYHQDEKVRRQLEENLKNHAPVYTVSLGLANLLANFEYVGTLTGNEREGRGEAVAVHSVVPVEQTKGIVFEEGRKYFKEVVPVAMQPDRLVTQFTTVVYDPDGQTLTVRPHQWIELENGEHVLFF